MTTTTTNQRVLNYIEQDKLFFGCAVLPGQSTSLAADSNLANDNSKLVTMLANTVRRWLNVSNPENFLNIPVITNAYNSIIYDASKGEITMLNDAGHITYIKESKATAAIARKYGSFLRDSVNDVINNMGDNVKDGFKVFNAVYEAFMLEVMMNRQPQSIETSVDIFADHSLINKGRFGDYRIVLKHNDLEPSERIADYSVVNAIVSDWKEHFKDWDTFVDSLVYSRISPTRRKSFLWLNAPSSFGKGLMLAALDDLGLVYDMKMTTLSKCMSGDAVGVKPEKLLRSWVLSIDEWNSPKAELKMLNDKITVSPKNKMEVSVPLYLKLFTSKEDVQKLTSGGIEKQFDERFFAFIYGNDAGRIEDRTIHQHYGEAIYRQALSTWLADTINAKVSYLRSLGKDAAQKLAAENIAVIQNANRLSTSFGSLDTTKTECSVHVRECIREAMKGVFGNGRLQNEFYTMVKDKVVKRWITTHDESGKRSRTPVYFIQTQDANALVSSYIAWNYNNSPLKGKLMISAADIANTTDYYHGVKNRYELYDSESAKSDSRKKVWGYAFPVNAITVEVNDDSGKFIAEKVKN